jgi:hypothetical protein
MATRKGQFFFFTRLSSFLCILRTYLIVDLSPHVMKCLALRPPRVSPHYTHRMGPCNCWTHGGTNIRQRFFWIKKKEKTKGPSGPSRRLKRTFWMKTYVPAKGIGPHPDHRSANMHAIRRAGKRGRTVAGGLRVPCATAGGRPDRRLGGRTADRAMLWAVVPWYSRPVDQEGVQDGRDSSLPLVAPLKNLVIFLKQLSS